MKLEGGGVNSAGRELSEQVYEIVATDQCIVADLRLQDDVKTAFSVPLNWYQFLTKSKSKKLPK